MLLVTAAIGFSGASTRFSVHLRCDGPALASKFAELTDPASPNYAQWLSASEVDAVCGVDAATLNAARQWAEGAGRARCEPLGGSALRCVGARHPGAPPPALPVSLVEEPGALPHLDLRAVASSPPPERSGDGPSGEDLTRYVVPE